MQFKDQQSAHESYVQLMSKDSENFLIDVRSRQEWFEMGIADLSVSAKKLILCEWRVFPSMRLNEHFFTDLNEKIDFEQVDCLYFICAAGVRSKEASNYTNKKLKTLGFSIKCVNVFDGFNGNSNAFFNVRKGSGWKASGLPFCWLEESMGEKSDRGLRC